MRPKLSRKQVLSRSQRRLSIERLERRLMLVGEIEPNGTLVTATPFQANDSLEGKLMSLGDIDHGTRTCS